MTHTFDALSVPELAGLTVDDRENRAEELRLVVVAIHEQAAVLYAGADGRAALTIQQLNQLAAQLQHRAARYRSAT